MNDTGDYLVALGSGVALSFAFPEPDLWWLAWIAIAPLLLVASGRSFRRGFLLGFVYGAAFFGTLLVWISIVGWVAWGVLVAVEALFIGLFGGLWAVVSSAHARPAVRVLAAPVLWVAAESLRAVIPVGGFTWGQLAQSQHDLPWMLKPAALGGGWTISFLVVALNAALLGAFRSARAGRWRVCAGSMAVVAASLVVPALVPAQDATGDGLRVAIVQGNVPRDFPGSFTDKELAILGSHARETRALVGEGVDLVVWPESAVGLDIEREPAVADAVATAARSVDAPMIVGGNLDADDAHYKVMAFEISAEGDVVDRYQKTHLVPFGEYVPARSLLDWIPMLNQVPEDALPGGEGRVFDVAGGAVAPVISYEGDFGPLVRERINSGGRLLVVATNTSTWRRSWASAQHVAFSKVRAAENGVWVVHAAISGISAFIQPDGRVADSLPLWTTGSMVADVNLAEDVTWYARTGEWLPIGCGIVSVALVVLSGRRKTGVSLRR
ncbi:MAG: apolipoprotein N-acyltransferase [Actinomycetota bacterium]